MQNVIKNNDNVFSAVSNLQTHYHFKPDFEKVDQNTGDNCLIHGSIHGKDNQLQSLGLPSSVSY